MPTLKQKKAFAKTLENGGVVSRAMGEADYSPAMAKNPKKLTESKGWKELMDEHLPDIQIAKKHEELLNSTKVEHMIFPLGPKGEDDPNLSGSKPNQKDNVEEWKERTSLTDEEIKRMLGEVNCRVKRIVHGETARHVYFWAADNKARRDALDMAYKLKGHYAPEKSLNLNVNAEIKSNPEAKKLAEEYELKLLETIKGNETET